MASHPKGNILLVDDQPSNLLALEAILADLGQNLVKAQSGKEALKCLLQDDFLLILMDVQMPDIDGLETAALIRQRERSQHTPIIFLTAYESTDGQMFKGYSLGAVDYLVKPIVPEILRSKVKVFIELFQKTEEVKRQAELLRENQKRDHEHHLEEERQRWEMERLRQEAAREKQIAEAMAQKAAELARTVAERSRAEAELAAVKDQLAIQLADMTRLHQTSIRLSNTLELTPLFQEILTAVTALQDTDLGVLMRYDPQRHDLYPAAGRGFPDDHLQQVGRVPLGQGACGSAVARRVSVLIEDADTDPLAVSCRQTFRSAGIRAVHSTPLLSRGGDIIGTVAACFRAPHRPSDRQLRLVELYTRQAATVLDNARLYAEIQESNQRKDEFLAMLAHELRNPLAPILNALHVMRLKDHNRQPVEKARMLAEEQVLHLSRLVDDLLDVSRITGGKIRLRKEVLELATLVARTVENMGPVIEERHHRLELALPPESVYLEADPTRLEQILINLLNNAAKYTEPGGRIWLTAAREGNEVVLRVRDTGIGIAAEMLPKVFDMFTQADRSLERSQGGLGIGLTLVRKLVELHGGTVGAFSAGPGQGSEFVARLPALIGEPTPERPASQEESTPRIGRALRILVVDDNRPAAESLAMVLGLWGHQVEVAHDGPAALQAFRDHPQEVVLLDIGLPGMDGYAVARRLREQAGANKMVLIAVTGYGQEEDRRQAQLAGFDLHLVKPVDPTALRELLAQPEAIPFRREPRASATSFRAGA
jgi:signal transduction histidine kinase/DNA-binding response OmpR family regulator